MTSFREDGIRLDVPPMIRSLSILISVLGYALIFLLIPERVFILSLLFWTTVQFRGLLYAPEITVYPDGIQTKRLGIIHFTHWSEIEYFHKGQILSQIYPKTINKYVRRFLYNHLMVNKWRRNYDEAIQRIEDNVAEQHVPLPERSYE